MEIKEGTGMQINALHFPRPRVVAVEEMISPVKSAVLSGMHRIETCSELYNEGWWCLRVSFLNLSPTIILSK